MKLTRLKYYIGVISILLIGVMHVAFFENNDKYDVYLFYNHKRYLTNILYDISVLFDFSLLTYWAIRLDRIVFKPLFILSLLSWCAYFLNYNQRLSLILIPIYIIIAIYYYKKKIK